MWIGPYLFGLRRLIQLTTFSGTLKPLRINSGGFFIHSSHRQTCTTVSPYVNLVRCSASFRQPQMKQGNGFLKRGLSHRIGLASMVFPPIMVRWNLRQHRSWGWCFRPKYYCVWRDQANHQLQISPDMYVDFGGRSLVFKIISARQAINTRP